MIRILVVDDHPVVRAGLVLMLGTQPDMEVVGEAGDGQEAVGRVAALAPDVVLMDLEMPGLDGVEAIQRIHAGGSEARILVLTAYDTDERILQAVQAGARGYLLKGAPRDEIFQAVRVVHGGGSLLQPAVATKLLDRVGDLLRGEREEALTERELQVLELMAKGYRNKEIARDLCITERTVKFHANILFQKLNVDSRTEAVSQALQRGIIKLS
ncbi:MAG: response regulator transcription factor [Chloroflexota bacterium]|nr:response regulator transcription factor [Chloroflexota bacterium]